MPLACADRRAAICSTCAAAAPPPIFRCIHLCSAELRRDATALRPAVTRRHRNVKDDFKKGKWSDEEVWLPPSPPVNAPAAAAAATKKIICNRCSESEASSSSYSLSPSPQVDRLKTLVEEVQQKLKQEGGRQENLGAMARQRLSADIIWTPTRHELSFRSLRSDSLCSGSLRPRVQPWR